MSANNAKVQAVIETTFNSAINKLAANEAGNCYSDLYVQVDAESGELLIYDEEDVLVEKTIIFDWVNTACDDDQFTQQVAATLKAVLAVLVTKKVFWRVYLEICPGSKTVRSIRNGLPKI